MPLPVQPESAPVLRVFDGAAVPIPRPRYIESLPGLGPQVQRQIGCVLDIPRFLIASTALRRVAFAAALGAMKLAHHHYEKPVGVPHVFNPAYPLVDGGPGLLLAGQLLQRVNDHEHPSPIAGGASERRERRFQLPRLDLPVSLVDQPPSVRAHRYERALYALSLIFCRVGQL